MLSATSKRSDRETVPVSRNELRQLLFWASVGVKRSKSGAYWECIEDTVRKLGKLVGFKPAASWGFNKK